MMYSECCSLLQVIEVTLSSGTGVHNNYNTVKYICTIYVIRNQCACIFKDKIMTTLTSSSYTLHPQ